MKLNMGTPDRSVRALVGVVLVALPLMGVVSGIWAGVAWVLAAILLVTAVVGVCPLYLPFGLSTRRDKAAPQV